MSSGFFRFYAHMGVLHALEENDCLRVKSCSGSSAGALVRIRLCDIYQKENLIRNMNMIMVMAILKNHQLTMITMMTEQ